MLEASHNAGERFAAVRGMKQSLVDCLAALSEKDTVAMAAAPAFSEGIFQLNSMQRAACVGNGAPQCRGAQPPAEGAGATRVDACWLRSDSPSSSAQCTIAETDPLQYTGVQFAARCRSTGDIKQQCNVVDTEVAAILDAGAQDPGEEETDVKGKENKDGNAGKVGKDGQGPGSGDEAYHLRVRKAKAAAATQAWKEETSRLNQELESRKGAFAHVMQLGESMEALSAAREQAWCELDAVTDTNALYWRRWSAVARTLGALGEGEKAVTAPANLKLQELDAALGATSSCQGLLWEEIECTFAMTEGLATPQPLGLNDTETDLPGLTPGPIAVPHSGSAGGAGVEGWAEAERQRRAVAAATGGGLPLGDDAVVSPLAWWQGVEVLASWPALPPLAGSPLGPVADASTLPPWSQCPPGTSIPGQQKRCALRSAFYFVALMPPVSPPGHLYPPATGILGHQICTAQGTLFLVM